jgi:hypothetical protein
MSKYRCQSNFECEICHVKGTLQILSKTYARVRHYTKLLNGKPQFQYHRNSIQYVERMLKNSKTFIDRPEDKPAPFNMNSTPTSFDEEDVDADLSNGSLDLRIHDQKAKESSSFKEKVSGRRLVWFRTQALQACDPGSKSRRPHQHTRRTLSRAEQARKTRMTSAECKTQQASVEP